MQNSIDVRVLAFQKNTHLTPISGVAGDRASIHFCNAQKKGLCPRIVYLETYSNKHNVITKEDGSSPALQERIYHYYTLYLLKLPFVFFNYFSAQAINSGHFDPFRSDPKEGKIIYDSSSDKSLKNEFLKNEKNLLN